MPDKFKYIEIIKSKENIGNRLTLEMKEIIERKRVINIKLQLISKYY
jgi:hypothetical protein